MTANGPFFRVVAGHPTGEEVAALAVALLAVRAAGGRARPRAAPVPGAGPATHWADRADLLRAPLAHGPGAWRRSALPH